MQLEQISVDTARRLCRPRCGRASRSNDRDFAMDQVAFCRAMSALECADQASPRTCAVKPPPIAALTTKAFFRECQTGKPCRFPPSWPLACVRVRDEM